MTPLTLADLAKALERIESLQVMDADPETRQRLARACHTIGSICDLWQRRSEAGKQPEPHGWPVLPRGRS